MANKQDLLKLLEESPVIAAIKDDRAFQQGLDSSCKLVFLLYGNLISLPQRVQQAHAKDKLVLAHLDLIDGLQANRAGLDYLKEVVKIDGIISTKDSSISQANKLDLLTVQRFFALDSKSLANFKRSNPPSKADLVELIPGIMPRILKRFSQNYAVSLIAGGLIEDKTDIYRALDAGCLGVSTSKPELWQL